MKIAITGSRGFVGRHLTRYLENSGDMVIPISRKRDTSSNFEWILPNHNNHNNHTYDAIVHLAGEPIASGGLRWSQGKKEAIYNSRITGTANLLQELQKLPTPPKILIAASAIGYYGDRGDEVLTEDSPPGNCDNFLSRVVQDWEQQYSLYPFSGMKVVIIRFGVVLGDDGGMLKALRTPTKWGGGAILGSGKQWISWIHINDLVRLIHFTILNATFANTQEITIINGVAPTPYRHEHFMRKFAQSLGRPTLAHIPSFLVRMLLGEKAQIILDSQHVISNKLHRNNFSNQQEEKQEQKFLFTIKTLPFLLLPLLLLNYI